MLAYRLVFRINLNFWRYTLVGRGEIDRDRAEMRARDRRGAILEQGAIRERYYITRVRLF
jgi:hypothetical protein